jgi:hypothetical protein
VTKFLLMPFCRTLGAKAKFLSRSYVLVAAKTRQVMIKYTGAVKWQFQTAFNMLGWIPAVSTRQAVLSFQRPSIPCTTGIDFLTSVTSTCQMLLLIWEQKLPKTLSERADGLRASGQTLQELIAPSDVLFFDSKWGDLGTKESLETVITDITKIKGEVLRDANNMGEFSVAQKMSWASERVTTRVEDIA